MSKDKCPCGYIILADTEDWETPLCFSCYFELTKKTKDYQSLQSKLSELEEQAQALVKIVEHTKNLSVLPDNLQKELSMKARQALEAYEAWKGKS